MKKMNPGPWEEGLLPHPQEDLAGSLLREAGLQEWELKSMAFFFFFWCNDIVLKLVMVEHTCEYSKKHWIVHFKWVNWKAFHTMTQVWPLWKKREKQGGLGRRSLRLQKSGQWSMLSCWLWCSSDILARGEGGLEGSMEQRGLGGGGAGWGSQGPGSTAAMFSSLALPKCLHIKSCPRTWLMRGKTLDPWLVNFSVCQNHWGFC